MPRAIVGLLLAPSIAASIDDITATEAQETVAAWEISTSLLQQRYVSEGRTLTGNHSEAANKTSRHHGLVRAEMNGERHAGRSAAGRSLQGQNGTMQQFVAATAAADGMKCRDTAGCGQFRESDPCHCNDQCARFTSCCSDFLYACSRSCGKTSCDEEVVEGASCQCYPDCELDGSCCADYQKVCGEGGEGPILGPTDDDDDSDPAEQHPPVEACDPGFGGPNCDQELCTDAVDCSGHGVAWGYRPTCSCTCAPGWVGYKCGQLPCDRSDCTDHGTADGVKGDCRCTCDRGWGGPECANQMCTDKEDCNDRGVAYGVRPDCKCSCSKEYDGDRCLNDKAVTCAELGCAPSYVEGNLCQCSIGCLKFDNCCQDFVDMCQQYFYKPEDERLLMPSEGEKMTFYMYRADAAMGENGDAPLVNANLGSLGGVLWYLHNEVIQTCTGAGGIGGQKWGGTGKWGDRKFAISRIRRFKVSIVATQPLLDRGMNFGVLCTYDDGECTGPHRGTYWSGSGSGLASKKAFEEFGFVVGCGNVGKWPHQHWHSGWKYPDAIWYGLPGSCPILPREKQYDQCKMELPGGRCDDPTGAGNCTFSIEDAGEIEIDELVGIMPKWSSRGEFCTQCGSEGSAWSRGGCGLNFWGLNIWDEQSNHQQVKAALQLFSEKFPEMMPAEDMAPPKCDFDRSKYGFVHV
eukprot:TRINITY_DN5534_c0_g4_i1.p1 TRINITY_DN5534_c0_g4~~TRINITY_DN5534_c0_g4_i1.p1  ORF type:complete len:718 (-),score=124.40 TRINITY_DN5534_c0_g4_i1:120-2183(-)